MTSELQTALIPVAKDGKAHLCACVDDCDQPCYETTPTDWEFLPGADDTFEGEVEVVLGWLAKAGYDITIDGQPRGRKLEQGIVLRQNVTYGIPQIEVQIAEVTLHAALAATVLALAEVRPTLEDHRIGEMHGEID